MSNLNISILRYNPEKDDKPYYQDFTLTEWSKDMRVLDVLHEIKWKHDGTLTFRRSCAHGICGSDGMKINGKNRLACSLLLGDINTNKPIVIEPLPSLPIIKDLVVDMSSFFMKYEVVKPYLINTTPPPPDSERLQSNEDAEKLFESAKCILCACCTTSCPSTWTNENYIGPAALLKTYRFAFDTRDDAQDERLDIVDTPDGIWRCHTIFNCIEACPKEINITWHISQLKKKISSREI
ncbi:MAG TPA: succinate dehydrogenase iron-sulfur subunit [Bacteroidetes bacterium]|nr:succinate dehydrogenase iron-sulfur subunit [Bacteroidota bacterium]HCN36571.1 succinate dehydrogenase iron-sulfur subunit [Bacteroidota bacterium]